MRLPTEEQFFRVLEADAVDRAFVFMRAAGLTVCENCLCRELARTLVETLFPFVRKELKQPRRSYQEIVEIVDNAVLRAFWWLMPVSSATVKTRALPPSRSTLAQFTRCGVATRRA